MSLQSRINISYFEKNIRMKRREFIPGILATALTTQLPLPSPGKNTAFLPPETGTETDEDFWEGIRAQYRTGKLINLNNGGVSPQPLPVEEAFFNYHRIANDTPSFSMWRLLERRREEMRHKLADLVGCPAEEVAINRNTTEALVTVIDGIPLKRGDEVVLSVFDYPRMLNAWRVRERNEGIRLRWVTPDIFKGDKAALIGSFVSQFSPRTRVVHITHMINWTGALLPAKEIAAEARQRNIISIVDAAHSVAHVPFRVADLDCDYLGASLHKWLGAPFGSGMLYVRKDRIERTPALFPHEPGLNGSIKKFEELGTRNIASELAILHAIDFHNAIGGQRKYDRLVELRNHWVDRVKMHPKVSILTPLAPGTSGGICLVSVKDVDYMEADRFLIDTYGIHSIHVFQPTFTGIRIAPNVYTRKSELDLLSEALLILADKA